jgi:hypothetical protein
VCGGNYCIILISTIIFISFLSNFDILIDILYFMRSYHLTLFASLIKIVYTTLNIYMIASLKYLSDKSDIWSLLQFTFNNLRYFFFYLSHFLLSLAYLINFFEYWAFQIVFYSNIGYFSSHTSSQGCFCLPP